MTPLSDIGYATAALGLISDFTVVFFHQPVLVLSSG